jgi:hypothetical protein
MQLPVDDVVYVWWYDKQGVIQSNGINFVQDLPYFLVLLLCFERSTLENWGVIPIFNISNMRHEAGFSLFSVPIPPLSTV